MSRALLRNKHAMQTDVCSLSHASNGPFRLSRRAIQSSISLCARGLLNAHQHPSQACFLKHAAYLHRRQLLHLCRAVDIDIDVEEDTLERMDTTVKVTKEKFATIRTGRASPSLLDLVKVDYYGAPTQLKALANITAPESSLLVVAPFDKGSMDVIEKAIMTANLGLTPNNDGKVIRINVPQLTADRRKEMAKSVSKLGEEGKVAVRNVRRDAMKALDQQEKAGDLSEDEKKALEDSVQEMTDESVKQIDALVKAKQNELTSV